ncbi:putative membrane protein [Francisella tularensis]|uniref:Uncharacterized protein n=3 Tax=Francisella tularensis TaxID=263 RepID=Q5NES3_FRATT|nr:hypothetical protein NE061598_08630 [Francisella tularensis subsp. tularensis NE061598]AJI68838.1 putative membrane protein [Francisella tularensis subsp. tularensis SCHU S4]AJI71307.1 putative membrane protein [Francisella tularensis subsp. tularensis]APS92850.1 hypothetical protein AV531_08880 [Francisella tularensis]EDN35095.1 conserved hypothetical protein [Francisella tularensis subsp. tularensis FSC033]EET19865.1 conserved hypothetical protein [Francisella tularensis subsp. tularensis
MYEEQFLAEKLQQFSLLDIALVKIVYFLVGLLVATNYIVLTSVSWIFYLLMFLIAVFPIVIHLFSHLRVHISKKRVNILKQISHHTKYFCSLVCFFCMYISSINTSFKFSTVVCLSDINHNFCN